MTPLPLVKVVTEVLGASSTGQGLLRFSGVLGFIRLDFDGLLGRPVGDHGETIDDQRFLGQLGLY